MSTFIKNDFLLNTEVAKQLYNNYCKDLPIIDYHCHVNTKEIYENKKFKNITEVWLGGDHYKWRLMRSNGVEEKYIAGNAPDKEKFFKFAELLPKAIGNPMYHWCHLELKKYFGYDGVLNKDTANDVWELTEKKLQNDNMSVRGIIEQSNVSFIGTIDDPIDTLEYHKLLKEDKTFKTVVDPSFRPDKALQLNSPTFTTYIKDLENASNMEIDSIESLKKALRNRMDFFAENGCRASDHGLNYPVFEKLSEEEMDCAFKKAIMGEKVSEKELEAIQTELVLFCAEQYYELGWIMQIHFNCIRNPNSKMFEKLGSDTGFDIIGPSDKTKELTLLLDSMYKNNKMPKVILYSLNGSDNSFIDTLIGAFQSEGYCGTVQHGSAWWFNDTLNGMREQMTSLASLSLFGNFIGMLTDSRSFLSYTRHEYFRRILCSLVGSWVENGEYPNDMDSLKQIVSDISFYNAKRYFNLEEIL